VIENLEFNLKLEELNLERNKISKIIGLEKLRKLKKLELGGNQISRI